MAKRLRRGNEFAEMAVPGDGNDPALPITLEEIVVESFELP